MVAESVWKSIKILYRSGQENASADTLSCNQQVQVAAFQTPNLLPGQVTQNCLHLCSFVLFSWTLPKNNAKILSCVLFEFFTHDKLPNNEHKARKVAAQELYFSVIDKIICFVDSKHNGRKRCAMPKHLCK